MPRAKKEMATGPAVYRAWCGKEMYARYDHPKPVRFSEVTMGHSGDHRHENPSLRQERKPPEQCQSCPKLKKTRLTFLAAPDHQDVNGKTFIGIDFYMCPTFTVVPGAVPPEEAQAGKDGGERG